ncbi:MAG: efflux system, outer rane lipoprotein, NodT [Proteobacteria bacterium]|nr:efflux system, outer rane lipoprotein, NodT [Pseudomonadota bacterium]
MKPVISRALSLSALLVLNGCSLLPMVGPDYQLPSFSLPAFWSTTPTTAATAPASELASWWRQLDDPLLDRLIDEALAGSVDLKLAQSRLQQARASREQAVSGLFPALTASAGASRNKSSSAISTLPTRTLYDAGFDASWEIDLFGGTWRGVEAATAELAASQASLHNVRVSLLAEVAQNYVELRAFQHRLAIARDNLASQSETVQITEWRNQAGLASSSDVEQARTSREQTRASIPDLEIGRVAAENRLAVLLGKNPGALHGELAEMKDFPPVPASVGAGIPADVLRQRPDLIVAERTLAAETARLGQKQAQRFPSLNLGGSFGWQAYSFGALGGSDTLMRAISGTLAATLFDGGRLRSAVAIQSAVQEQALLSYQSGVLGALEEVENALTAYAASRERLEARQAAAEAARNAASLARNLYQSGLTDFQKVLETERTRLSAEDSLATAQGNRLTSLITLYKALGGGWQQAAPTTENEKS